jgi:hypothetical protein
MWKLIRISLLLIVLMGVLVATYLDRRRTAAWNQTLALGIFPVRADSSEATRRYVAGLKPEDFASIGSFFASEAGRYGIKLQEPVRVLLYREPPEPPPARPDPGSLLANAWWSLKLRRYAAGSAAFNGGSPAHLRVFVLYHDPARSPEVPHSLGLQKGLVGVVHAFASGEMTATNAVIIAHETMHTLGATDKYDPATNLPRFPDGYAEPERVPREPQEFTEIMAGRRPLTATTAEIPESLANVLVGEATAREIHWLR